MILILDFGSQYTQLIARRIRENNVYSEIVPYNYSFEKILLKKPEGIILSGSPYSINSTDSPKSDFKIFDLDIPILGICYGMQFMADFYSGKVENASKKEFGEAKLKLCKSDDDFLIGLSDEEIVWMSHGDKVEEIPDEFISLAETNNSKFAIIKHKKKKQYGVQFHPEVVHTKNGFKFIKNFVVSICKAKTNWNMKSFIEDEIYRIKKLVDGDKVIAGLSGGVDSTVMATLINKAVGKNLKCIFVDNGLLRKNEAQKVKKFFKDNINLDVELIDAKKIFLDALENITDPEKKRKIIGHKFIEVFEEASKKFSGVKFLAQGTLYPDVIESISVKGPSSTIKSHHNVGGLPDRMNLALLEPLKFLFKDEVRILGKELDIPDELVNRQPFPGPGLAVRILGNVTNEKIKILQDADEIILDEIKASGFYNKAWQTFGVLLPIKSVGVMGDERTYENVLAVRSVDSIDGMTATWSRIPYEILAKISSRIINEVRGINRVCYDISSKPPATIEWE